MCVNVEKPQFDGFIFPGLLKKKNQDIINSLNQENKTRNKSTAGKDSLKPETKLTLKGLSVSIIKE